MRVSGYHDRDAGGLAFQVEMRDLVDDVDANLADVDVRSERQLCGPRALVVVSANRERGSDVTQVIEHLCATDVAGVDDEIGPAERLERLRPKKAVRIRDHPDLDRRTAARDERAPHRG